MIAYQIRSRSIRTVSGSGEVVDALGRREGVDGGTDDAEDVSNAGRSGLAQERLQLGEGILDRIEVWRRGRKSSRPALASTETPRITTSSGSSVKAPARATQASNHALVIGPSMPSVTVMVVTSLETAGSRTASNIRYRFAVCRAGQFQTFLIRDIAVSARNAADLMSGFVAIVVDNTGLAIRGDTGSRLFSRSPSCLRLLTGRHGAPHRRNSARKGVTISHSSDGFDPGHDERPT
ncbi:hypothetical protein [Sphingomonas sp. Leaf231]|uniref:hypothetical protein n=1 Tax=Sphingomonas sp. Leaf231 TaxID=1736301 RepID=UPI000B24A482